MGSKDDGGRSAYMAQAREFAEKARQAIEKVDLPDTTKMELALKYPELILSSDEEKLQDTALSLVKEDPELAATQERALAEMEQLGQEGFGAEDRAKMEALRRQTGADEKARQESILADMAARGAGGSGAELAARLSSSQSAADRENQASMQLAADTARARREAMSQAGSMASQMGQQRYARDASTAQARDQIAAFNAQVAARDTGARRQQEGQKVQTQNVQQQYNKELNQRQFENEMRKQGAIAQGYGGQSSAAMQSAQMAKGKKGLGGIIGTVVGGGAGAFFGGPQGAGVGANLGGAVGSQFADGGIKLGLTEEEKKLLALTSKNPIEDISRDSMTDAEKAADQYGVVGSSQLSKEDFDESRGQKEYGLKDYAGLASSLGGALGSNSKEEVTPNISASLPQINVGQSGFKGIDPSQVLKYENGGFKKMGYEEGGIQTEGRIVPGENFEGDELSDKINSGEMVINAEQQDRLNEMLKQLANLRTDERLEMGAADINEDQQEDLMEVLRGEQAPEELEDESVVEEKGMKKLLRILGSK